MNDSLLKNDCESQNKCIRIVYFSGTGGTARAVDFFDQALKNRGFEVQILPLDSKWQKTNAGLDAKTSQPIDLLILLFAVHALDAPEPVFEWIKRLPKGNRLPVAVISVSGGGEVWPNMACRLSCINALEYKGYKVFYERMFNMPSNWIVKTSDHLAMHLLNALPRKVAHSVSEIFSGVVRRTRPPIASVIMTIICKSEKLGAKFIGKDLAVRSDCTGCGWCSSNCPRGNIGMKKGRPSFGWRCIACMRCIYGCPAGAIYFQLFKFIPVQEGYDLDALEKRMKGVELEPVEKLATGAFGGLRGYLMHEEQ